MGLELRGWFLVSGLPEPDNEAYVPCLGFPNMISLYESLKRYRFFGVTVGRRSVFWFWCVGVGLGFRSYSPGLQKALTD